MTGVWALSYTLHKVCSAQQTAQVSFLVSGPAAEDHIPPVKTSATVHVSGPGIPGSHREWETTLGLD